MSNPSLKEIVTPFTTNIAQLTAYSGASATSQAQLYKALQQEGFEVVVLRPPVPWEPLAPLRHLCEHWEKPWPNWQPCDLEPEAFWLGIQVIWSRFFLRVTERLQGCPTVAWISHTDFQAPLWGDFLRLVQQGQLKLPLSFIFALPPGPFSEHGVRRVALKESPNPTPLPQEFSPALPKRVAQYLSQSLFFGDQLCLESMQQVSRARHCDRIQDLKRYGVLDETDTVHPERLRFSGVALPPSSLRWKKKAYQELKRRGKEQTPRALWLQTSVRDWSAPALARSILSLGATFTQSVAEQLSCRSLMEEAKVLLCLALSRIPDSKLPPLDSLSLRPGYRSLVRSRWLGQQSQGRLEALNECMRELNASGPSWAAALLATELAQWYLKLGRVQFVFSSLKPHHSNPSWATQWMLRTLYAKAFAQMNRMDLARNSLEQAVAITPKPMSPVLAAELRLLSLRQYSAHEEQPTAQKQAARDVFRSAGDGVRLGHFLVNAAELPWRQSQWVEARNLLVRALDLFRRYHDGMGQQETQLKLGLVLKEKPIDVLVGKPN